LTPSEGRKVLNKILENTPYTGIFDEFPKEDVKEILEPGNELLPIQPTPMTAPLSEPTKVEPPVKTSIVRKILSAKSRMTLSAKSRMTFSQTLEMPQILQSNQSLECATLCFNRMLANLISPL
jgi:hypothetical protein